MVRLLLGATLLMIGGCSGGTAAPTETPDGAAGRPSVTAELSHTPESEEPAPDEPACDAPCYEEPRAAGVLDDTVVTAVSGMAASLRTPGVYYVVSDEAGTTSVAAVEEDGAPVASIEIVGMDARNAEALATGRCGPSEERTCLYVGDIGNHVGLLDLFVYRVPEPDLSSSSVSVEAELLRYTYPEEPFDAEALLVDHEGRPLIIGKASFDDSTGETGPTHLFRGPVEGGVLERLAEIALPDPANPVFAELVGNVVTGGSSSDGAVMLRTYDEVLEFRRDVPGGNADDLASFPDWPVHRVPSPEQMQSESVTYRGDECGYLTTGEMLGDIAVVPCSSAAPRPSP